MLDLKSKIKNIKQKIDIFHLGFAFITIGLGIALYFQLHKGTVIVPQNKPVVVYKDKKGNIVSEIVTTEVDKATIKLLTDSIAKILKGRNSVEQVTTFIPRIDTVIKKVPVYIDTNNNFHMEVQDNYIKLRAEGNVATNEGSFTLQGIDTMTYVDFWDKHLFRADERKVAVINKNPYIKITEGSSITLKSPKVLLSVGPQVGVTLYQGKIQPYVGIGVGLNLFSLKMRK